MIALFEYLLKSALSISILYIVFELFFKNRVSFLFNRLLLLTIVFFGLLIPIFTFNIGSLFHFSSPYMETLINNEGLITINLQEFVVRAESQTSILGIPFYYLVGLIYISISILLAIWFLAKISRLFLLAQKSETKQVGDFRFIILKDKYPTFSFFNLVFINKELYNNVDESQQIIEHEAIHSYQKHTVDVLLSELLIIVQWFNPVAYLLRKSIKENHEFLADKEVLRNDFGVPDYKLLLLRNSTKIRTGSITHNFSYSLIKKRFKMMEKKESKIKFILAMMILPIAFSLAFYACSSPELNNDEALAKPEQIETTEVADPEVGEEYEQTQDMGSEIFTVVEVMPVYDGGIEELYKFLGNNIKYPEEAKKDSIQGRVFVNFIVETDGSVTNVNVLRGIGGGCDEESIRVVSMMPKWTPGTQRGKAVRVSYNLPIKFSLK